MRLLPRHRRFLGLLLCTLAFAVSRRIQFTSFFPQTAYEVAVVSALLATSFFGVYLVRSSSN